MSLRAVLSTLLPTIAALAVTIGSLLAGCTAPTAVQPPLSRALLPSQSIPTMTPAPPETLAPIPPSTDEVFSWEQARTLVALGTDIERIRIETATPWPTAPPPPQDGFEYFTIAPSSLGELLFAYDSSKWRLVAGQEKFELAIEGDAGLVHRDMPECKLYELFGRDSPATIHYESWDIAPEIQIGITYYKGQDGIVRLVTFPGAILQLTVPPDRWEECVSEAKAVVQTYLFIPSASP